MRNLGFQTIPGAAATGPVAGEAKIRTLGVLDVGILVPLLWGIVFVRTWF